MANNPTWPCGMYVLRDASFMFHSTVRTGQSDLYNLTMDFTETKLKKNPQPNSNVVSKLLFTWIIPLFRKGYKSTLTFEDLYDVLDGDRAKELGDHLEERWTYQIKKTKESGAKGRLKLVKVLLHLFGKRLSFLIFFYCLDAWIIQVATPILLRLLIQSLNDNDSENTNNSWEMYAYAGGICLATLSHALLLHPVIFSVFHVGMQARVALSAVIYRKALRLSKSSNGGQGAVGKLVNILSNDVNRFDTNLNFLPTLIAGPVQFLIFIYFLWDAIGVSCLTAVGFVTLFIPIQYIAGKFSAKFRLSIAERTDARGKLMNEIITGIRVIKMYAWEKPFSLMVDKIRRDEVKELRKRGHLKGIYLAMANFSPKLIVYITFLVYVLTGNTLSSDNTFFTVTCLYTIAQIMIHFIPLAAAGLGELFIAVRRIEEFMLLEEQQGSRKIGGGRNSNENNNSEQKSEIILNSMSASWTSDKITLDNIAMNIDGDKLIIVTGAVGSGKTSFLHALIGELPTSSGTISISGSISYASQEPWIFAGNLRQNIIFGQPFDPKRYSETLKSCALEADLLQLPYGDLTVVGERGVALSGGQKARVNLARALYRRADIYLMDDPLSAVDVKVSRQLFDECIQGEYLRNSLRILVTHQLQYLPSADHIIVLDQGKIIAQGRYKDLVNQGVDFGSLMGAETKEATSKETDIKHDIQKEKGGQSTDPDSKAETMASGSVTFKTYWEYFKTGKSSVGLVFLLINFIASQVILSGNDFWLSYWANAEDRRHDLFLNKTGCMLPTIDTCEDSYLGRDTYLIVYSALIISVVVLCSTRAMFFYYFCTRISVNLHNWMFRSIVRAPTKFFDDNPSGRIMNRFTKDMGTTDELLPAAFADTATIFLNMIGVISVVIISNYYLSVPTVFLFLALYFLRRYFVQTSRDLKRIESLTRSPLFTHVAATMQGITTIRASNTQEILIRQFDGHQDKHSSAWYLFIAANRCFGVWLELVSCLFLTVVSFSFLTISSSDDGGNVGLAISSVLTLMGSFQWGMRQSAETENFMTSVERAFEYAKITPEAPLESKPSKKPPTGWPSKGEIKFEKITLSYDQKPVLKDLSFEIGASQKIGIVGRTGAGKSSIMAALFRMTEPTGQIYIDGVLVNEIGLHDLRRNISVIPQDPVLFSGPVRYNLDPFDQFEDHELWKAIEEVELKDAVPSLDFKVEDCGSNFSVGERQLFCLARACLRENKIIIMDEATANVDSKTDALIQKTIKSAFSDSTIITIAHRLHSVIDCDRVLVLDDGKLMEYNAPHILLQNPDGVLTSMVAQTGKSSELMLKNIAEEKFTTN